MSSIALNNNRTLFSGDLSTLLLYLFPLLTIRGGTNNNYIIGAYLIFIFGLIILNKAYLQNFNFVFYKFKTWIFLIIWGIYILFKSPIIDDALIFYFITIISPFLLFQIINNIELTERLLRNLFQLLFFSGFCIGAGSILYIIFQGYDPTARLTSFWTAFNMVSGYLMMLFLFNLSFLINRKKGENVIFYLITIFFILFGMFLTQTRGVWMATIFAVVFYFIKRPKIIIPVAILLGFFVLFFYGVIQTRVFTIVNFTKDASAIGRIQAWLSSVILIMQNPLFGYGFDSYINLRDNVFSYYVVRVIHSHNTFLRVILEMGLIGSVFYFYFFFKAMYYSFTFKKRVVKEEYKRYIDGLQLNFVGLLIIFNFEPYFSIYDNACIVIWLIISLTFALKNTFENSIYLK